MRSITVLIAFMTPSIEELIKSALLLAATQLKALGIETETAKLEAQLLLQHALNVNRAWLISHQDDALQANIHAAYRAMLERRLSGEPIAYILGYREFYGLNLKVTPDTLIPRADTETLVEATLAKINLHEKLHILDLGTGTGAIAFAIAKHRPQAHVTALDASQAALDIAIENAQNLKLPNVKLMLSDWFSAIQKEKFDVIVSNPPYIEVADAHLKQGDLRFEPISALASGADGMDAIRHIIDACLIYLKPQGWLMLEHGYNQAELVAGLMAKVGFNDIETINDLAGNTRVTLGKKSPIF
jgi:release factor glutamine methyltransferase